MDYNEFDSKMKPLESQIADLEMQRERVIKEQEILAKQYLADSAIPLGSKVIVTTKFTRGYGPEAKIMEDKTTCFLVGRRVMRGNRYTKVQGDIQYTFNKMKKDGTASQIQQHFWNDIINIEVVKG